ncbi:hypothetical protein SKAU_G00391570 [Synaphobranchus kaupii]|uniref:Uncharacterized protein n=1 Tax=Synaphobranchus kaupii TaxID=118154 RepID=A0A9Q1EBL1_SYNKA|nr:hypothetical protein SKAU_G00391570 [Synaphobranchus kaupii]
MQFSAYSFQVPIPLESHSPAELRGWKMSPRSCARMPSSPNYGGPNEAAPSKPRSGDRVSHQPPLALPASLRCVRFPLGLCTRLDRPRVAPSAPFVAAPARESATGSPAAQTPHRPLTSQPTRGLFNARHVIPADASTAVFPRPPTGLFVFIRPTD